MKKDCVCEACIVCVGYACPDFKGFGTMCDWAEQDEKENLENEKN